ncbi:MAG: GNA1162 family protein [Burkholderiaceae bacterium]
MNSYTSLLVGVLGVVLLTGCATKQPPYDYTSFNKAKPATLLVMPPLNNSPDIKATPSMWATATKPLAEAGYYVLPVTLVDETLRQNGVETATDAHAISINKLQDYFGADAAVYIKVSRYGATYAVVTSETVVEADAKIVDLRTGAILWEGTARASSAEQQQSQSSVAGLLIAALVNQIVSTTTDAAHNYAGVASDRLLAAPRYNGVLPGPRSQLFGKTVTPP